MARSDNKTIMTAGRWKLLVVILFFAVLVAVAVAVLCLGSADFARADEIAPDQTTDEVISHEPPSDLADLQKAGDGQLDYWATLPTFDSRKYNIVTSTKNQGNRNICWAYATVGAVESNILRKGIDAAATKDNLDLDERLLAYARFNRDGLHDPLYLTAQDAGMAGIWDSGDNGSNAYDTMTEGFALVRQNDSLNLSDLDAMNGELMQSRYAVKNYHKISANTNDIKRAILEYGSVSFSYVAPQYQSKYYSGKSNTNHESLIVGWDDTVERSGFSPSMPTSNGAWIVKNSWGPYGNNNVNGVSCFYMSYEQPIAAIYVVDVAMREDYQNIYHYDGQISYTRAGAEVEKQAAIYEAKLSTSTEQEQLTAVTMFTDLSGIDVTVEVHKGLNANPGDVNDEVNNPEQGPAVESKTAHIDVAGYHTIDLDNPVKLEQGEFFSIVISSEQANKRPVATCTSDRSSVNDMTYYYIDGKWESYKESENYADTSSYSYVAKIRAITNTVKRRADLGKDLKYARIEIEDRLVFYEKGEKLTPPVEVYFGEELLTQGEDYNIGFSGNDVVGTATVKITGAGAYRGERTTCFEVAKAKYVPGRISGTLRVYDDIVNLHDIEIPSGWRWIDSEQPLKMGKSQYPYTLIYEGADAGNYQNPYSGFYVEKIEGPRPAATDISLANMEILGKYVYTGESIQPRVKVTYAGKELGADDYELTVKNNTNAGLATVTVSGIGKYTNEISQDFEIGKARWPSGKPKSTLTAGKDVKNISEIVLEPDWEWQKTFDFTGDSAEAVAVYKGADWKNYANLKVPVTITREREVAQKDIASVTLSLDRNSFVYDGEAKLPKVIAQDGGVELKLDTDYEVEYGENVNAGTGSVTVWGINNYSGFAALEFTIDRAERNKFKVTQEGWTYGAETIPAPSVEGKNEDAEVSYTYSDSEEGEFTPTKPTNAGTYWIKAVIAQSKNYKAATATAEFTISKAAQPKTIPNTEMTISRKAKTLQEIPLTAAGWEWQNPSQAINGETITAVAVYTAEDKDNYENIELQITITKEARKDIQVLASSLEQTTYPYNGSPMTPNVAITDGGYALERDTDYEVKYNNNTEAGQASVIVTGIGDYTGEVTLEFTIDRAERDNFRVTQEGWTYGAETIPEPSVEGQIESAEVNYTYSDSEEGEFTPAKPTNAGTYWIRAVIAQSKNYKAAEDITSFTISKAAQPKTIPNTEMTISRKVKTLKDIPLTAAGWEWKESQTPINGETITAIAVYTAADRDNYENIELQITITKEAPADVSTLSVALDIDKFTYNGTEITPNVIATDGELTLTLGKDYDTEYVSNKLVGQGKVIVTFKGDYTGTKELTFTIEQAEMPSVDTTIHCDKPASSLSDITLPDGFEWEDGSVEVTGNRMTAKAVYKGEDASCYKNTELVFEILMTGADEPTPPEQTQGVPWLGIILPIGGVALAAGISAAVATAVRRKKK